MNIRRPAGLAAALLVGAAASLGAQGAAVRETVLRRGDRAIHHVTRLLEPSALMGIEATAVIPPNP